MLVQNSHVTVKQLDHLEDLFQQQFNKYKELFYDPTDPETLKWFTLPMHSLRHMPEFIRQTGMPINHYAYSMERSCKLAKAIAQPCGSPVKSISNKLLYHALSLALGKGFENIKDAAKKLPPKKLVKMTKSTARPVFDGNNDEFAPSDRMGLNREARAAISGLVNNNLEKFGSPGNRPYPPYNCHDTATAGCYFSQMTFKGFRYYSKQYYKGGLTKRPENYSYMLVKYARNRVGFAEFVGLIETKHTRRDMRDGNETLRTLTYHTALVKMLEHPTTAGQNLNIQTRSSIYENCEVPLGKFIRDDRSPVVMAIQLSSILGPAFFVQLSGNEYISPELRIRVKFFVSRHFPNQHLIEKYLRRYHRIAERHEQIQQERLEQEQLEREEHERERQRRERTQQMLRERQRHYGAQLDPDRVTLDEAWQWLTRNLITLEAYENFKRRVEENQLQEGERQQQQQRQRQRQNNSSLPTTEEIKAMMANRELSNETVRLYMTCHLISIMEYIRVNQ